MLQTKCHSSKNYTSIVFVTVLVFIMVGLIVVSMLALFNVIQSPPIGTDTTIIENFLTENDIVPTPEQKKKIKWIYDDAKIYLFEFLFHDLNNSPSKFVGNPGGYAEWESYQLADDLKSINFGYLESLHSVRINDIKTSYLTAEYRGNSRITPKMVQNLQIVLKNRGISVSHHNSFRGLVVVRGSNMHEVATVIFILLHQSIEGSVDSRQLSFIYDKVYKEVSGSISGNRNVWKYIWKNSSKINNTFL